MCKLRNTSLPVSVFAIISLIFLYFTSQSQATPTILRVSTGDISLGPATVRLDYTMSAELLHPSTAIKGATTDWRVRLSEGKVTIIVDVAGRSFSHSVSLPLGERREVTIIPGLKAYLYLVATAPINIAGKASSDTSRLEFTAMGEKTFKIKIDEEAIEGDKINVSLPFELKPHVGLTIDLLVLRHNVGETLLGTFTMEQPLTGTLEVVEKPQPINLLFGEGALILWIGIALIGGATGAAIFVRRKRSSPTPVQGLVGVIGGVISMVSLWYPWINYEKGPLNGIEMGAFFHDRANVAVGETLAHFLFILTFLMVLGGYLHVGAFKIGASILSRSARITIIIDALLLIVLSFIPRVNLLLGGWIMLVGAIIAAISTKLQK